MPYLAGLAAKLYQWNISSSVAKDYMNYLQEFPDAQLFTRGNLIFINAYQKEIHYNDPLFQRYVKNKKLIDSVMGSKGYAEGLVGFMVYNEEIQPQIDKGIKDSLEPDWNRMEKTIEKKYGTGYTHSVVKGKVAYFYSRKLWNMYAKYLVQQVRETNIKDWEPGFGSIVTLDNDAFEVFKYSSDKKDLEEALFWINQALMMEADKPAYQELDTKANLLYKLGKKKEALILEEQAFKLSSQDKEIADCYNKMKNDQPTW